MKQTLLLIPLLLMVACHRPQQAKTATAVIAIPAFNADSAYNYVASQVAFGPRVPQTTAHSQCLDYLTRQLRQWSDTLIVNSGAVELYNGTTLSCHNIVASFDPAKPARILICAHWDTRPYSDAEQDPGLWNTPILGADDGASGVGVIMEIARAIATSKHPQVGIDFILFDLEDWGAPTFYKGRQKNDTWCLGSQYWARNPHTKNYRARYGILLDMVGSANATFYREQISTYYAPHIVNKIWNEAKTLGHTNHFVNEQGGAVTDDHLYINQLIGIPTIDIIQHNPTHPTGFSAHWHTQNDNLDNISPATLHAVWQTLLNVIYKEN